MSTKEALCDEMYLRVRRNNYRVLELIRMVRELMPVQKKSDKEYDFIEVLGIVQDTLKENEDLFDKYEEDTLQMKD